MKIYVPSRDRPDAQHTAAQLRDAGVPFVIVRSHSDESRYPDYADQLFFDVRGIADKRQKIMEHAREWSHDGKFVMIDDDVEFRRVLQDEHVCVTTKTTPAETRLLMSRVETLLDQYAIVGIAIRFMIDRAEKPLLLNSGRMVHFLAYNLDLMRGPPPRWDRLSTCEDFDFTMQLVSRGLPRAMITDHCLHEVGGHASAGGCSHFRSPELEIENNRRLMELWPDYVSVTPGTNKIRISWRKLAKEHGV